MSDSQNGPQAKYFPAMKNPMFPTGTFNGKIAFVTGGGTGLGRCIALFLSSLGAQVAIASRKLPGENLYQITRKHLKLVSLSPQFWKKLLKKFPQLLATRFSPSKWM